MGEVCVFAICQWSSWLKISRDQPIATRTRMVISDGRTASSETSYPKSLEPNLLLRRIGKLKPGSSALLTPFADPSRYVLYVNYGW
jgi:hypothetical protein